MTRTVRSPSSADRTVAPLRCRSTRSALAVLGRYGFALAGGYAAQAHGLMVRPSEDVDLFARNEARDFIDVYAARVSGYTSDDLEDLATRYDRGFNQAIFAQMLDACDRLADTEFTKYDISRDQIEELCEEFAAWSADIRSATGMGVTATTYATAEAVDLGRRPNRRQTILLASNIGLG